MTPVDATTKLQRDVTAPASSHNSIQTTLQRDGEDADKLAKAKAKLVAEKSVFAAATKLARDTAEKHAHDAATKLAHDTAEKQAREEAKRKDQRKKDEADRNYRLNQDLERQQRKKHGEGERKKKKEQEKEQARKREATRLHRGVERTAASDQHKRDRSASRAVVPNSLHRDAKPQSHSSKSRFPLSKAEYQMAARQTNIDKLPPKEREEQEKWAQKRISITGGCVNELPWKRFHGGYRCIGGAHLVTDELLAEGKGGYFSDYNLFQKFNIMRQFGGKSPISRPAGTGSDYEVINYGGVEFNGPSYCTIEEAQAEIQERFMVTQLVRLAGQGMGQQHPQHAALAQEMLRLNMKSQIIASTWQAECGVTQEQLEQIRERSGRGRGRGRDGPLRRGAMGLVPAGSSSSMGGQGYFVPGGMERGGFGWGGQGHRDFRGSGPGP